MPAVSRTDNAAQHFQLIGALEKKGVVALRQKLAVRICTVIYGGLAPWRSGKLHVNGSVSHGAKWISLPCQALSEVELEQDMQLAYVLLEERLFQDSFSEASRQRLSPVPRENIHDPALDELLALLLRESRESYIHGLLFTQSLKIAREIYLLSRIPLRATPAAPNKGGLSRKNLRRCLAYIEEHFARGISLDDLAREAGVSRSHLIRSFRHDTGASPYQYVLRRRVEHAKSFMKIPHYSLTDVALACGFANQHHLSRVFRSIAGHTPSEYRSYLG